MLIEEKILSLIDQSKSILVVSHKRPDGDSVGSALAMIQFLKNKEKTLAAFCVDAIPENLKFLPNANLYFHGKENLDLKKYDLVITFDCGEAKQSGIEELLTNRLPGTFVINIDHHFTNDNFGDLNLVDAQASSTSEIVDKLFNKNKISITKAMTNCLLTGILTDTTYFSNAATTIDSIYIASSLLNKGAKIREITKNIWKNKNVTTLKLWGRVFERLIHAPEQEMVTAIITEEDLSFKNLPHDALDGLANFLTSIYEAKIILVLLQLKENLVKGSLRTTHDHIDVATMAKKHGGGGHQKAAGFTVEGRVDFDEKSWKIFGKEGECISAQEMFIA